MVLREGHADSEVLAADPQEHAKTRLARYTFPRVVELVAELPRNDRGEVVRRALSERA